MLSCYSGFWKSARWYKIGFHYVEIFVFNAHWLNTKFGKSKLSLLHFHPVVIKSLLGAMLSQSLQSSLSAPNFYYLKQSPQKRAIRKSIVVTNVSIVAWVVKKQIVVNQGFFVMVALKSSIMYWTTFQVVPWSYQKSNLWGVNWLLQNTDLFYVNDNDPFKKWFDNTFLRFVFAIMTESLLVFLAQFCKKILNSMVKVTYVNTFYIEIYTKICEVKI